MRTPLLALAFIAGIHAHAQKQLTNELIWKGATFGSELVGGLASMNDGAHYTVLGEKNGEPVIFKCAYATGDTVGVLVKGSELVPAGQKDPIGIEGYEFSADEKKLMITTATEPIYRYSFYAYHYVYDLTTKKLTPLTDLTKSKQRLATFSPDGSKAAFVRDNDLYAVDIATGTEVRVSHDGQWNKILNGATDWVYEEEFTLVQGYQWSPNGTKLLFLRSDESNVREFDLTTYEGQLYPGEYRFKYPKAGEANSTVQLWSYDLRLNRSTQIPLGDAQGEVYLPRFGWTSNDNVLWFMRMNRLQNEKKILTVDLGTTPMLRGMTTDAKGGAVEPVRKPESLGITPRTVYHETSKTYVEVTDDLYWTADGTGFILTSEKSGWNHIYWNGMDGTSQRAITTGEWDVIGVQGIDEKNGRVIFTAAKGGANQQEVWGVSLKGKALPVQLSPASGVNNAEWSKGFRYFINTHSTSNTPPVITLHDGKGKQLRTLKDNVQKLAGTLREYGWQPVEFFQLTTEGGVALNGWMIKPPGFQSRNKYPVMMTQYSGPNSNEAMDSWDGRGGFWNQLLAQKGYIVVCVDPRGTGHRGRDFRHITYGQLGKYETEDQIGAAKWLAKQTYVDGSRIGIWGWSYGGYMSSLCITKGADVFKMAIAVAPVTNWRYYDTIYTERYMGLPQDNAKGYDDNSPINHVEKLKGKYLLVHGMADDNVHMQNSTEMITALVKANKQFDLFLYPDKNHGIYGGNTRLHLYTMLTDYILENL